MVIKYINPNSLQSALLNITVSSIIIFDMRDDDYTLGHIKNAINIPFWDLEKSTSPKSIFQKHIEGKNAEMIIFHCHFSQNRGPNSAKIFINSYPELEDKVYVLEGGWKAWSANYLNDNRVTTPL